MFMILRWIFLGQSRGPTTATICDMMTWSDQARNVQISGACANSTAPWRDVRSNGWCMSFAHQKTRLLFLLPQKGNGRGKLWLIEVVQVESCVFPCLLVSSFAPKFQLAHSLVESAMSATKVKGFWQKAVSLLVVSRYCACDQCSVEDPGSCWIRGSSGREGALDGWWLWL